MKKHRFRIIVIIAAVITTIGIWAFFRFFGGSADAVPAEGGSAPRSAGRSVPVTVHIAEYMAIDQGYRTVGTLLPNEQVELGSEVAGLIDRITFDEGSHVGKGSLLVKINSDDLENQLMRTELQRDLLREKLERNRVLLERDAVSREAFDQIQTDYNMIEADIQLLRIKIGKTAITSPMDGMIGFRDVSVGTYVSVGTRIASIIDASKLKLEFSVPEKYSALAREGTGVSFTVQSSAAIRHARVYAVDPRVDPVTKTIAMRALYDNADNRLTPGMFASVMVGQTRGTTIQIPTQAIVPSAEGSSVWLVQGGRAVAAPVATGVRSESMVEITRGLAPGDSVIMSGLLQVREGGAVQVMN